MGFVHDEDFETPDFTPQDIRVCKDVEQLREWLSEVEDARDDIKSQIDAAQVTGLIDNDWLLRSRGAYAFASMGAKRVKRRMRELGHTPEPKEEVAELRRVLDQRIEDLNRARSSSTFGKCLLAAVKEALPQAAADAIIREASERVTKQGAV